MLEAQLAGKPGSILTLMGTLPRAGQPGTLWNYNTGETQVVGELIHAAVKRPVAEYLSEPHLVEVWHGDRTQTWWLESPDGQGDRRQRLECHLARLRSVWTVLHEWRDLWATIRFFRSGWVAGSRSSKMIGGQRRSTTGTCGGFRMLPPIPCMRGHLGTRYLRGSSFTKPSRGCCSGSFGAHAQSQLELTRSTTKISLPRW